MSVATKNSHYSYVVSNHQPPDCLLNRLFRRWSKKASKLRVTGLCAGNSPETGEFPAQMASNAENVSIWWRHHVLPAHRADQPRNMQPRLGVLQCFLVVWQSWDDFTHIHAVWLPQWYYSEATLKNIGKYISLIHRTSWWRHQVETFSALLVLCVGNSPVTGEFPSQRPVTRSFDVAQTIETLVIWEAIALIMSSL